MSKIITFSLGLGKVSAASFSFSKNQGLQLEQVAHSTLHLQEAAGSFSRELTQVIQRLAAELGCQKSDSIYYSLSSHRTVLKFFPLPMLSGGDMDKLVSLEAQQQVPFPLAQALWDYEAIPLKDGSQEIFLAAIKHSSLEAIQQAFNGVAKVVEVQPSPVSHYQALIYRGMATNEDQLLVDIGEKSTQLLYFNSHRFFVRTLNFGAQDITRAIMKAYECDLVTANSYRDDYAIISLDPAYIASLDEGAQFLVNTVSSVFKSLPAKINQVTHLYQNQHKGGSLSQVHLVGSFAKMNGLDVFLGQQLNLPTSKLSLDGVALSEKAQEQVSTIKEYSSECLNELLGLAVFASAPAESSLSLSLLPQSVHHQKALKVRKTFWAATSVIAIVALSVAAFAQQKALDAIIVKESNVQTQLNNITPLANKVNDLLDKNDDLARKSKALSDIQEQRILWLDILNDLSKTMAHDEVWVTTISGLINYQLSDKDYKPYILDNYPEAGYGVSIKQAIRTEEVNSPRPGLASRRNQEQQTANTINAILIKGFWRDNDKAHNVIYDLLDQIRASSHGYFSFEQVVNAGVRDKEEVKALTNESIVKSLDTEINTNKVGSAFEFVLFLSKPIQL